MQIGTGVALLVVGIILLSPITQALINLLGTVLIVAGLVVGGMGFLSRRRR